MKEYENYFETIKLSDNNNRVLLKDDAPQELRDLVRNIHGDLDALPCDWIYSMIKEAISELNGLTINPDTEFDMVFWINIEADIYHADLLRWLYENGGAFAIEFCDQALKELNPWCDDFMGIIATAQKNAKVLIHEAVFNFLKENIDG